MELASLTGKRIFLVVDRAALRLEKIEALLSKLQNSSGAQEFPF
jgi:hypothetical protein